jgi:PRTRC genetic system protein B
MNSLTSALNTTYKPVLAIVLHATEEKSEHHRKYYLESHEIDSEGKIREGKPLQQESIEEMVEFFYSDRKDRSQLSGFVPENVLCYSPVSGRKYRLVWYRPAEVRYIHFASQLKIKSGKAWVPPMIYSVYGSEMWVYALKNNTRPKTSSKPYRAPFHNVADNGKVCLGTARIKKPDIPSFEKAMKYWEDLFWLSEFSHLNGASNPTKTDLDKVWRKLIAKNPKTKWSDIDELKPMKNKNLESILK